MTAMAIRAKTTNQIVVHNNKIQALTKPTSCDANVQNYPQKHHHHNIRCTANITQERNPISMIFLSRSLRKHDYERLDRYMAVREKCPLQFSRIYFAKTLDSAIYCRWALKVVNEANGEMGS